ncbi:MAG: Gfo/Idh/MocA family oxidoreductase [Acidobacteria bacterium]|nr:Gfo/Idh/MocA family oxidoreductase [Acidobacteriota bacterium]
MLNWIVLGIGDITTKRVIPAIEAEPRSRVYGVVSRDAEKGRRHAARVWAGLEEALEDPAVEAVYVATPVALHAPQSIAAMRAGRHVLCEKPMAMNYPEALRMVGMARETGVKFGVAYYRRLYPKLRRAQELLAAGAIGRPLLAEIRCHDWFVNQDGFRAWLLDPALAGGGPLYDIGSHRIDVLNFLFGRPVKVSAHLSNTVHRYAVEDSATLLIEYESGVRGVCDVRWNSRVARDEFRIVGTDGVLELTPLNGPRLVGPAGEEQLPPHANLHYPLIENFVSAVLEGVELASSGETALATDAVTQAAVSGSALPDRPGGYRPGSG